MAEYVDNGVQLVGVGERVDISIPSPSTELRDSIVIKENELYQEIELFVNNVKIGEAEVDIKGKMLSRLSIIEQYQNNGYGTKIVKMLNEKYGCDCLWVNADNNRAIHVYEKCGFKIVKPTMYLMEVSDDSKRSN